MYRLVNIGVLGCLLVCFSGCDMSMGSEPVKQPMTFNHQKHAKQDIACLDCHKGADKGPHATVMMIDGCFKCHEEEQKDEHPDVKRIREYHQKEQEIPWIQVNRLPGNVYFSHEAHVTYGKMKCAECHGKIEETTEAIRSPQITGLTMATCIKCHQERHVFNDCFTCHK